MTPHETADIAARTVLTLVKGDHRFTVIYDDDRRHEATQVLGRWANNPALTFTWYDAALLCQRIRRTGNANHERRGTRER